jgi:hypothetical protein
VLTAYIFLLGFCAVLISAMGAGFSVHGLATLFSGSFLAVAFMAGALEVGKLVIAGFLHARWPQIPKLLRTYLTAAVVVLMSITSMGIFGFLSNSYQMSSVELNRIQIQSEAFEESLNRAKEEIARMTRQIDEIPSEQSSKKLLLQKRFEPLLADSQKRLQASQESLNALKLEALRNNGKVGPLLYVAKAFNVNIDTVVKWLILVFVAVFDPLAICLVLATGTAVKIRREELDAEEQAEQEIPKITPVQPPKVA